MSELMTRLPLQAATGRWLFLGSVSVLALLTGVKANAAGDNASQPMVWIELGSQLERVDGTSGRFLAPFMDPPSTPAVFAAASPVDAQRPPRYAIGGNATISIEPNGTDWKFSAAIRYGRSNGNKQSAHQSKLPTITAVYNNKPKYLHPNLENYARNSVKTNESHLVLDFAAGKDVGLGMFGRQSTSTVEFGVRIAQFTSQTAADIRARPDIVAHAIPPKYFGMQYDFHNYALTGQSARSFHGIGPALSWTASAPVLGNRDSAEFSFDWGVNAAVLFGRQKARISHHTVGQHYHHDYSAPTPTPVGGIMHYEKLYDRHLTDESRNHGVAVPDVGGFVGMSLKFPNAKVSVGYRGDFFFGAMDTGMDARKTSNVGFNGPFASISIGLGG